MIKSLISNYNPGILEVYEPVHNKTYNKTCATSKDSDRPAHPRSPIRVFADRMHLLQPPGYSKRDNENHSHTGRMYRLIWVFAGHTGHIADCCTLVCLVFLGDINIPMIRCHVLRPLIWVYYVCKGLSVPILRVITVMFEKLWCR